MKKDTVTEPAGYRGDIDDPSMLMTEVFRSGAQRLLIQATEAGADAFLALMAGWKLEGSHARFVRHGHGLERDIQTGMTLLPEP